MSPPFDADKYEHLMSGLEAVEITLSEVVKDNDRFRFDAEYFRREYLKNESFLKSSPFVKLKDTGLKITHPAEIIRTYVEQGVWFFRAQNLKPMSINDSSNKVYISVDDANMLCRNVINKGDILITRTGNVGDCAIYYMEEKAIASSHVLILRSKKLNHYYLAVFLNTKYGRIQIEKGKYGSLQPEIAPYYLENIIVPLCSKDFQEQVKNAVEKAEEMRKLSASVYASACDLLLSELGLKDYKPSTEKISIKTLKESFLRTGRLDAEYYQAKYEEVLNIIKEYKHGYDILENVCIVKNENFIPDNEVMYKYIELSSVNNNGLIEQYMEERGKLLPKRARRLVKENDIIVSSIEGSLEKTAIITANYNDSICSTGFYVVRSNQINAQTLMVLFKSEIMYSLIKQHCSGTILTSISEQEFKMLPIPLIDIKVQNEIASYIEKSISYSKEAKNLLKQCVCNVEKAIENSNGGVERESRKD